MNIKKSIEKIEETIREEEKKHEEKIISLKKEIQAIRKTCSHKETKYHPDASGNNDSWRSCIECGAEV